MKRIGIAVLSAASLMAAGTAVAAEPQWTYGQLGWIQGDGEDDNGKAEGFQIKGSIGLEQFHAAIEYIDGDVERTAGDVDFDGYTLTVGYHMPITSSRNTHFVADLSYFDLDLDLDGGEGDTKGFGIGFGVRSVLADRVELEGMITYSRGEVDSFGGDEDFTDTGLRVGARYLWTANFSTGLTLNLNDPRIGAASSEGSDSAIFDLRWSFGDLIK